MRKVVLMLVLLLTFVVVGIVHAEDTPPGTILDDGGIWRQAGLEVFAAARMEDIFPTGLSVDLRFTNTNEKQVRLIFTPDKTFEALDNNGRRLKIVEGTRQSWAFDGYADTLPTAAKVLDGIAKDSLDGPTLASKLYYASDVLGAVMGDEMLLIYFRLDDATIQEVIFKVNVGPIKEARWRFRL